MDNPATHLNNLLGHAAASLDVPASIDAELTAKYRQLADWLAHDHTDRYRAGAEIYPQGSRRLGTMTAPVHPDDDHDVDLVYRRDMARASTTRAALKSELGVQLRAYLTHLADIGDEVPRLEERSRCWTLRYGSRFHMDILPALPNDGLIVRDTSILIPDKRLVEWQVSNPQGYAAWFELRMRTGLREQLTRADAVHVHDVPANEKKVPLQRTCQILKRHRDIAYDGDRDHKPASVILTTLAARCYPSGANVHDALDAFARDARSHVERRDGVDWIPNPTNAEENFADKWRHEPVRRDRFYEWLDRVRADLSAMARQDGVDRVATILSKALGPSIAEAAVRRSADELRITRERGALLVTGRNASLGTSSGTPVRPHTFYGRSG